MKGLLGMLLEVAGGALFLAAIIAEIATGWIQNLIFFPWGLVGGLGALLLILGNKIMFPDKSKDPVDKGLK